jgi:hypothetical protein
LPLGQQKVTNGAGNALPQSRTVRFKHHELSALIYLFPQEVHKATGADVAKF